MEEVEKEVYNEEYPKIISIEGTKKILEQMENSVCKIYKTDGKKGTGFFCNIKYENKEIPVMMTNYHIINDNYIKENDKIKITFNDDKEKVTILLRNRIIYTNEEYDITIIEIKDEKDKIKNYMKIDEKYLDDDSNIIYDKSIYVIQYPLGGKVGVSYGIINKINEYNIEHYCNTEEGSSGSPIINIINNEIIGIHKEGLKKRKINRGTLLKYPINDFIETKLKNKRNNEIEITLKVLKKEINKEIYYLDNIDYEDENKIKHYHDNLEEFKDVELYINNKEYEYKKYFKPEKEGEYKIRIKFKDIKDCSFMFAGCENIIKIDFINFNSKNVINMKYMFSGCINLKYLDLSKFNTENVTNMEGMFGEYNNLSTFDLSLFEKVQNKEELDKISSNYKRHYLGGCKNLKELNLPSSFNTQNVTNMMNMFCGCLNIKELNLPSSFNTQNVII